MSMFTTQQVVRTESDIAVIQSSDNYLIQVDVLFLSIHSDFFRCAFYGANKSYAERQRGRIHLPTIDHNSLVLTLKVLRELVASLPQSTKSDVTKDLDESMESDQIVNKSSILDTLQLTTALEVLDVAAYLQIESVLSAVSDVIFRRVTPATILAVHRKAEKRYVPLANRLWRVIVEDFAVLYRTGVFVELSAAQMLSLFRDPKLNLQPSNEYPAVSKWLAANSLDLSTRHSADVLELRAAASAYIVRMTEPVLPRAASTPLPSSSPLTESPSSTVSTTSSSLMVSLSDDIIARSRSSMAPPPGMGFYNAPRIPQSILLAVGGWASGGPTSHLEFYDGIRNKWMPVQTGSALSCPQRRAYHTVVAAADRSPDGESCTSGRNCLYVIGGYDGFHHHKSVHKFNLDTRKWSEVGAMNEQRCYVSGDALDEGHILVAGGFNETDRLRNAEIFDIAQNQWTVCHGMNAVRSDADCVNVQGRIYAIGGFNGHTCHNTCEVYDPVEDKWTNVSRTMRHKRSGVKATRVGEHVIFVVGGFTGSVRLKTPEFYDTREGIWHLVADMINKRSNFGIDTFENRVLVCGGYNNVSTTNLCESYEFRTNRWAEVPEMSFSRSALTLTRIDRHSIIADVVTEYDCGGRLPIF